ncbi:MAG: SgcJ/EcaC family oxidoreductase [Bryobacteraceae bacterium]
MRTSSACLCAIALTLMFTFAGCQTAPAPAPQRDVAAELKAIEALNEQYIAAANAADGAAVAAVYADDAIEMPPNEAVVEGKQAIRAMYETFFKGNANKHAHTAAETQLAGDWAYQRGVYTNTLTPKSGKPTEESGKYLLILKRQPDGAWNMYRLMYSADNPQPGAGGKKQ